MASYYSWRIPRIMLLPFGGMAEVDEHGNRPLKEEAFVILAGPIQHLWLFLLPFSCMILLSFLTGFLKKFGITIG